MKKKKNECKLTGAYRTNPIIQPDSKQKQTNVALPDEENVWAGKDFVDENQK